MKKYALGLTAVAAVSASAVALTPAFASDHESSAAPTYTVTIRNLDDGQYLTPPNWAAHDASVAVWRDRHEASPGVQAVAENGGVPVLAEEIANAVDEAGLGVSGVGAEAPIPPGGEATFSFQTDERNFSLVSMVICTNDGFAGLDRVTLPAVDEASRTVPVWAFDAGTEINTEMRADLVPAPFCGEGDGTGETNPDLAENGIIRYHPTLRGDGDLDPVLDWAGAIAEVEITRADAVPSYTVTLTNETVGQYLTPPNFAFHSDDVDVFEPGQAASPGVQAVAENGGVPVLAEELTGAVDDAGKGISGVVGETPIAPGESRSFTVSTTAEHLSIVSMLICTNDGFAGLDSVGLPRLRGAETTWFARAWDAGTEINTELDADIVPAPFCLGDEVGSGESNPELAENSVISRHRGIRGVGDFDQTFDFGAARTVRVDIVRN